MMLCISMLDKYRKSEEAYIKNLNSSTTIYLFKEHGGVVPEDIYFKFCSIEHDMSSIIYLSL